MSFDVVVAWVARAGNGGWLDMLVEEMRHLAIEDAGGMTWYGAQSLGRIMRSAWLTGA